jgi:hypothetical protein
LFRSSRDTPVADTALSQLDILQQPRPLATVVFRRVASVPPAAHPSGDASSGNPGGRPEAVLIKADQVRMLDLSPLEPWFSRQPQMLLEASGTLELCFDWPRAPEDPRELSEIPELRLWSLRADALCPWLPLLLERSTGQLTRHVAMLLPHSFSRSEGIRFAADSLELWMTHRLYLLDHWSRGHALNCRGNLGQMAAVLGYEIDESFWQFLG